MFAMMLEVEWLWFDLGALEKTLENLRCFLNNCSSPCL